MHGLDIDGETLPGLAHHAVDRLEDDLGPRDGELIPFAPHGLDEHRQVKLAAPRHLELIGVLRRLHAQGDVVDGLLGQAVAQIAAGDVFSVAAGERRIVDLKGHGDRRLIDDQGGQGLDGLRIAQGIGDVDPVDPGEGDDLAGFGVRPFDLHMLTEEP